MTNGKVFIIIALFVIVAMASIATPIVALFNYYTKPEAEEVIEQIVVDEVDNTNDEIESEFAKEEENDLEEPEEEKVEVREKTEDIQKSEEVSKENEVELKEVLEEEKKEVAKSSDENLESKPEKKKVFDPQSPCAVPLGGTSEDCDPSCRECYCNESINLPFDEQIPRQAYLTRKHLAESKKWICLINPNDRYPDAHVWVDQVSEDKICTDGYVEEYKCICGNYYCGNWQGPLNPDNSSYPGVWNKCINDVCQISKGKTCSYDSGCDDDDACTSDTCMLNGSFAGVCENSPKTECVSHDGCCPAGCTYAQDRDCERLCEDGTEVDECSTQKPKMCGRMFFDSPPFQLVDNCKKCGCPNDLACYSSLGLCWDENQPDNYLFSKAEIESVGFEYAGFRESKTPGPTSGDVAVTYIQDTMEEMIRIFHLKSTHAEEVFENTTSMYESMYKSADVIRDEYGDRSLKFVVDRPGGGKLYFVEILIDEHRIGFQYADDTKDRAEALIALALKKLSQ